MKRKYGPQDNAETTETVTATSEEGEYSQEDDTSDKTFNPPMPKFVELHWNSKLITVLGAGSTEDRLCVIASFPGTDKTDEFLGLSPNTK